MTRVLLYLLLTLHKKKPYKEEKHFPKASESAPQISRRTRKSQLQRSHNVRQTRLPKKAFSHPQQLSRLSKMEVIRHERASTTGDVTGRERPTIDSIHDKLIEKRFTNAQLKPNILINALMHDEEKYDLAMSKSAGILSKLISDQHQPIIEGKTPEEAWNALQERFQHINPMSTSRLIYDATIKKLSDFKDVHEYTSSYQAGFDKVVGLLTDTSHYTCQSTEMYFQATMLMNMGTEYSTLVSAIQKDWKDETKNLAETVL